MQPQEIVALLSEIFKMAYRLDERWFGGHGLYRTAETNDGGPLFVLTDGRFGTYLANVSQKYFGIPHVDATRRLVLGHDPREVLHV